MNIDPSILKQRLKFRLRVLLYILLTTLLIALIGFWYFQSIIVKNINKSGCVLDHDHANAIVVITGGHGRINKGLELLSDGKANKMLISGVSEGFSKKNLDSNSDNIILGYMATNTEENAKEVQLFMTLHQYISLILVTNSIHMPRASFLFSTIMPNIKISVCPVFYNDSLFSAMIEYSKYITTYITYKIEFLHSLYNSYLRAKLY